MDLNQRIIKQRIYINIQILYVSKNIFPPVWVPSASFAFLLTPFTLKSVINNKFLFRSECTAAEAQAATGGIERGRIEKNIC